MDQLPNVPGLATTMREYFIGEIVGFKRQHQESTLALEEPKSIAPTSTNSIKDKGRQKMKVPDSIKGRGRQKFEEPVPRKMITSLPQLKSQTKAVLHPKSQTKDTIKLPTKATKPTGSKSNDQGHQNLTYLIR